MEKDYNIHEIAAEIVEINEIKKQIECRKITYCEKNKLDNSINKIESNQGIDYFNLAEIYLFIKKHKQCSKEEIQAIIYSVNDNDLLILEALNLIAIQKNILTIK